MPNFFTFIFTFITKFIDIFHSFWTSDGGSVGNDVFVELLVAIIIALFTITVKSLRKIFKQISAPPFFSRKRNTSVIPGGYWLPYGCIGRKSDYKNVKNALKSMKPVIVYGIAGVGKTTVCSYFYRRISGSHHCFRMPFVSLTNCCTLMAFREAVRVAVGLEKNNSTIDDLSLLQYIFSQKIKFIYFDNWEDVQVSLNESEDYQVICSFINGLCSNGISVLISSQECGPQEWINLPIRPLSEKYGRALFLNQLRVRGKKHFSPEEINSLPNLLKEMENHPLTIILTASLINEFNSDISKLLKSWYYAKNETMNARHYSLSTSLSLAWKSVQKENGASLLWGILSMYNNDFPMVFFRTLANVSAQDFDFNTALDTLRRLSIVSYNEELDAIHMLFPVKKQWHILADENLYIRCEQVWISFIPHLFGLPNQPENESPLLVKSILSSHVNCFLDIVERSIHGCDASEILICVNAMYNYYERSPAASIHFFESIQTLDLPPVTSAIIHKCSADILRLRKRREDDAIIIRLYEDTKEVFAEHRLYNHLADTYNCEGLFYYWTIGDVQKSIDLFSSAERLSIEHNYSFGNAEAKKNLGVAYTESIGNLEVAQKYLDEAKTFYERCSNTIGIAHSTKRMGMIYFIRREYDRAIDCFKDALHGYRTVAYFQGEGDTLARLCIALKDRGYRRELRLAVKEAEEILPHIPFEITKRDLESAIHYAKAK